MIYVALFKTHKGDPLCGVISALTRGSYTHAALLTDPTNLTIVEAFYPRVRFRQLTKEELSGIDFFAIDGLTTQGERGILEYAQTAIGDKARYSITNLFRFLPPIRCLIGEASDKDATSAVFCSEFVFDAVARGAGIQLLRAHSWEVAPSQLAWSPLLIPYTLPTS